MTSATDQLDAMDLQRVGLLLLAAAELSTDRYVCLRFYDRTRAWQVSVRIQHPLGCQCAAPHGCIGIGEHTATASMTPVLALERAVTWLREAREVLSRETPTREPLLRRITNGMGR